MAEIIQLNKEIMPDPTHTDIEDIEVTVQETVRLEEKEYGPSPAILSDAIPPESNLLR